jgi:hypothetical protein
MKYKDGMTIFNSAFVDTPVEVGSTQKFKQKEYRKNNNTSEYDYVYYDNFAYPLYLILSNTYHRNKRIEDADL